MLSFRLLLSFLFLTITYARLFDSPMIHNPNSTAETKQIQQLEQKGLWISVYYGEKCLKSKYFSPRFIKDIEQYKNHASGIQFSSYDCYLNDENDQICEKRNVTKLPGVAFMKDGKVIDYVHSMDAVRLFPEFLQNNLDKQFSVLAFMHNKEWPIITLGCFLMILGMIFWSRRRSEHRFSYRSLGFQMSEDESKTHFV